MRFDVLPATKGFRRRKEENAVSQETVQLSVPAQRQLTCQLARQLDARGPPAHHHHVQQAVAVCRATACKVVGARVNKSKPPLQTAAGCCHCFEAIDVQARWRIAEQQAQPPTQPPAQAPLHPPGMLALFQQDTSSLRMVLECAASLRSIVDVDKAAAAAMHGPSARRDRSTAGASGTTDGATQCSTMQPNRPCNNQPH